MRQFSRDVVPQVQIVLSILISYWLNIVLPVSEIQINIGTTCIVM